MKEILNLFQNTNNLYPWCSFWESKEAMDGMLTNVAIVLPEKNLWFKR